MRQVLGEHEALVGINPSRKRPFQLRNLLP
jgi:hypothetical protein